MFLTVIINATIRYHFKTVAQELTDLCEIFFFFFENVSIIVNVIDIKKKLHGE